MERRLVGDGPPVASVVVPTVPGSDHETTLACLLAQTTDRTYETVVVNNGSVDRSAARNRGLAAADGRVVLFTDDDTRPPADWVETACAAFAADDRLICLEGPVFGGARSRHPRRYVGCNLAVAADAARAVGGFRSVYSEWAEDIEFGWRLERDADGRCRFDDEFRMCHPSVPRTAIDPALERRLRREYPDRYAAVLGGAVTRAKRRVRAVGVTRPVNRALNAVRRRLTPSAAERRARRVSVPSAGGRPADDD